MLLFFTLFFILFGFWLILFLFNSYFSFLMLFCGIVFSFFISSLCIKLRLFSIKNEFLFLQFGFYKIFFKKIFNGFFESLYLGFEFLKINNYIDPVIDYLYIDNENIYENNLTSNLLNLNAGMVSSIMKNKCIVIHSINKLFFTPNQLYFLSLDSQKVNDDNLV